MNANRGLGGKEHRLLWCRSTSPVFIRRPPPGNSGFDSVRLFSLLLFNNNHADCLSAAREILSKFLALFLAAFSQAPEFEVPSSLRDDAVHSKDANETRPYRVPAEAQN